MKSHKSDFTNKTCPQKIPKLSSMTGVPIQQITIPCANNALLVKKNGRGEGNLSLLVLPLFCFWGPYMFYWLIVVDYGWLEGIW